MSLNPGSLLFHTGGGTYGYMEICNLFDKQKWPEKLQPEQRQKVKVRNGKIYLTGEGEKSSLDETIYFY
jgi:hypothetical protein